MKRALVIVAVFFAVVFALGTMRNPHFWRTADQLGDKLMREGEYAKAAEAYADPVRIGVAQYRNGEFEAAAKTFARVPGADGAFNQGNAWLMHGKYDAAIESYDRALGFRPRWREAEENKELALARKAKIDDAGKGRDKETADAYKPDEVVFDQKREDRKAEPVEMSQGTMSDAELQATWLRQVRATPGDFLRAKFAHQAARAGAGEEARK